MDITKHRLDHGAEFPYDADDKWWNGDGTNPPQAKDWAHAAARGILADLNDRRDIKRGFERIDEDVRAEIVESLAEIIRLAAHNAKLERGRALARSLSKRKLGGMRRTNERNHQRH